MNFGVPLDQFVNLPWKRSPIKNDIQIKVNWQFVKEGGKFPTASVVSVNVFLARGVMYIENSIALDLFDRYQSDNIGKNTGSRETVIKVGLGSRVI